MLGQVNQLSHVRILGQVSSGLASLCQVRYG